MAECPIIFINDPLIEITFLRHTKVISFVGTFEVCLVGLIILKHLGSPPYARSEATAVVLV